MGRRQVVRHRILIPTFGGSNPSAPVNIFSYKFALVKETLLAQLKTEHQQSRVVGQLELCSSCPSRLQTVGRCSAELSIRRSWVARAKLLLPLGCSSAFGVFAGLWVASQPKRRGSRTNKRRGSRTTKPAVAQWPELRCAGSPVRYRPKVGLSACSASRSMRQLLGYSSKALAGRAQSKTEHDQQLPKGDSVALGVGSTPRFVQADLYKPGPVPTSGRQPQAWCGYPEDYARSEQAQRTSGLR